MYDTDINDVSEVLHSWLQVVRHRQFVLWRVTPCNLQMASNVSENPYASTHMVNKNSPRRKRQQINADALLWRHCRIPRSNLDLDRLVVFDKEDKFLIFSIRCFLQAFTQSFLLDPNNPLSPFSNCNIRP